MYDVACTFNSIMHTREKANRVTRHSKTIAVAAVVLVAVVKKYEFEVDSGAVLLVLCETGIDWRASEHPSTAAASL